VPGCEVRSRAVRSSPADRIREGEKRFCCVTTRGRNVRGFNGLGRSPRSLTALFLSLSVADSDDGVSAMFGLAPGGLPAVDLSQAFWILAVPLVPAPRLITASASFAQADAWARSAPSGQTALSWLNVRDAHGSCDSQGKARGECWSHSPRALSKLEQDAKPPVYRLLESKTER
jgi:hypothetical protein